MEGGEGVHISRFHAPRCQEVPSSFSVEGNSPLCVLTNGSPFVYVLSPRETVSVWLYLCVSVNSVCVVCVLKFYQYLM